MEPALPRLHLEASELQSLVIHLRAASCNRLSSCNRAIHAQVLEWFHLGQPELSQAIHDSQVSPISLSGLMRKSHCETVREGDEFYFHIGLLDGRLLEPLLNGLEKTEDKPFCLAKFPFVLQSINMLPGTDPQIATSRYGVLAKVPCVRSYITLKFLSPTSFKLNSGQGIQQFPLPEVVFGNLRRRWNAFAPTALGLPKTEWSGLVADYNLRTERLKTEDLDERGAVGWIKYQFLAPEQLRLATILAHFAFFAGVGRKTAMGMGQVRVGEGELNETVPFFAN